MKELIKNDKRFDGPKNTHTIKLNIDDDVYRSLKNSLVAKGLGGSFHGISDEFFKKILDLIDDNIEEYTIHFKKKMKKNEKKP